jgi:hypothetical protein
MRILVAGDSWNFGFGVEEKDRWTSLLRGHDVTNISEPGSGNARIERKILEEWDYHDLIIVGWSSVSRIYLEKTNPKPFRMIELVCDTNSGKDNPELIQARIDYFESTGTYERMFNDFRKQIKCIEGLPCKVLHYTVFGDHFPVKVKHKLDVSFLEYLSNLGGYKFLFDIPFYESGFLINDKNNMIEKFCDNNFPETWKYACYERELPVLDRCKYFLECGHPSELGHKAWSTKIESTIHSL